MRSFAVADLSPQCEVRQRAIYDYSTLEQIDGAADVIARCSAAIWREPQEFDIPLSQPAGITLRWLASAETAGIATLREADRILSLSLLLSGLNADADAITIQAFHRHVVRELHDTQFEPSFELAEVTDRPLLATMGLFAPETDRDRWLFALADRCFAAAWFRRLGLA